MQGDMVPVMPSDARSSAITWGGNPALQVIPCQLQNSMDVLLHEAKTPAGPESWDLKTRSACRSFSLSSQFASGRQPTNVRVQRRRATLGDKTPKQTIAVCYI